MIVEYFGIPGSGKTFQTNLYKQQLSREGKKYIDISRYIGTPLWLKALYKIADYAILVLPKYRKQIAEYKEVCKNCPKEPAFVPFSLNYCIQDIVLYSFIYDIFNKFERFVVNDEGQLHRVISLIVQFNPPFEEIMSIYQNNFHGEKCSYIRTSVETAFSNIKKRNRNICPMDEMDDQSLKAYMLTFYNICEKTLKFNHINIKNEIS